MPTKVSKAEVEKKLEDALADTGMGYSVEETLPTAERLLRGLGIQVEDSVWDRPWVLHDGDHVVIWVQGESPTRRYGKNVIDLSAIQLGDSGYGDKRPRVEELFRHLVQLHNESLER